MTEAEPAGTLARPVGRAERVAGLPLCVDAGLRPVARRDALVAADGVHGAGGRPAGGDCAASSGCCVELGAPIFSVNNAAVTGPMIFGIMMWLLFIRFSVPVLGVFYGTSLIADEVEDKTITYLFTRPIPRGAVLFGKYLAYLVCTVFVVLPSIMLVWLLVVPIGGSLGPELPRPAEGPRAAGGGAGGLRRGVRPGRRGPEAAAAVGLIFVIGWEPLVMAIPGYLKRLSVAYYLQGLVPHAMPSEFAPEPDPGAVPGNPEPDAEPDLAGGDRRPSACGWPPGRSPSANTFSSNEEMRNIGTGTFPRSGIRIIALEVT